ncbi:MAG: hypothetical protein NZ821_09995, partial [Gloeomargarita sp. SKYB31]|nr:hypothetical protein [Gloeomargarita sp. SKYB31]
SSNAWSLTGNSGTNPAVNFLGTTDGQPLVIRTSNTERLRITQTGDVGIGTTTPAARLHVAGTGRIDGTLTAAADLSVDGNTTLGNAAADQLTVNAGTIVLVNVPTGVATQEVLLRDGGGQVRRIAAGSLVGAHAWMLGGNTGTTAWNGSAGNYVGHSDAQPLVIATTTPQPIQLWAGNQQVLRLNPAGSTGPAWSIQRDAGGNQRGLYAVDLQANR